MWVYSACEHILIFSNFKSAKRSFVWVQIRKVGFEFTLSVVYQSDRYCFALRKSTPDDRTTSANKK